MKKFRLGLVTFVASALCFGAGVGIAGEVDGKGNPVPGGVNGRSECSYSGQQDDEDNEGVFKSARTQSWGQLMNGIRLFLISAGFTPGAKFSLDDLGSCNPNYQSAD